MKAIIVATVVAICLHSRYLAQSLPLPLHENFQSIDRTWRLETAPGNHLTTRDNQLIISARANTHANLQRPLILDSFRATLAIQPDNSSTWAPSLIVYWDANHWFQVSYRPGWLYPSSPYVARRESTAFVESYDLLDHNFGDSYHYSIPIGAIALNPPARRAPWRHLGIEMDEKNLRALISDDEGKTWTVLRELPRDDDLFRSPAKLLIIGKGASDRAHANRPAMSSDSGDPGQVVESHIRDLNVEPLSDVAGNPARPSPLALRDEPGEKILASADDPSFDTVASIFPAMQFGREFIGVKDHKDDFCITPDSSIEYTGGYVYFQVGDPAVRFGSVGQLPKKHLYRGHLPIVISEWQHDSLAFQQLAFGYSDNFSPDSPINACISLKIINPSDKTRNVHLAARLNLDAKAPLAQWDLSIPPHGESRIHTKIPFHAAESLPTITADEFNSLLEKVANYWESLLASAATIDVPEQRVNDAYRAWLAYNFLNVDKIDGVFHPQDCSTIYPAVYGISACLYCRVLDDYGYHAYAQKYLESLLTMVQPDGTFIVNYGLPDAGALLIAIAHHYETTGDAEWLRKHSAIMVKIADRFLARRLESRSSQSPTDNWYGLVFEKPYCDYLDKAYNFVSDLTLAGGLLAAGKSLDEIGLKDEGQRFAIEGESYRRDILIAMKRSAIVRNGQTIIPLFPQTHALLKTCNYTALDYYGLQAGQILENGLIDPNGWEAKTFVDMLENQGGLILGLCRFAGGVDHAYTFGYWFNCLQRNQPKRVLLGFYSTLAYGMTRDTYSGVEINFIKSGKNFPTLPHLYSGSQQLALLRAILCYESQNGRNLDLCAATPKPWLADGKKISVGNFSTIVGTLSFALESHISQNRVVFSINPPTRTRPDLIRLHLRHPTDAMIQSATLLEGSCAITTEASTLILRNLTAPAKIQIEFAK